MANAKTTKKAAAEAPADEAAAAEGLRRFAAWHQTYSAG